MVRVLKLLPLLVVALVVAEVGLRVRARSAHPGREAPPLALRTLDGRALDLRDLRGRAVALNFWASWCGPCRHELPELSRVALARKGQCFDLVSVAAFSGRADVERAAEPLPYTVLFDEVGEAVQAWNVSGVPHTYVLDPQGRIRTEFVGAVAEADLDAAVAPLVPSSCPVHAG